VTLPAGRREILLNPGPVTLTERVRHAMLRPDQCHREAEFAELVLRIRQRIETVYDERPASHDAVVVSGSGTCAVEAMVASLVPREGTAIVAANGVYGERIAAMLSAQGKAHRLVRADWLAGIDVAGVRAALGTGRASAVIAVHHETTTGRLNQLDEIGRLCDEADVPLLLDAVSSFGGEAIDWQGWHLGAVAGTANKCLHGVPGIAFVLADRELLRARLGSSPSVYLDLQRYHREQTTGFSPFTQAVHACFALDEALDELADAGGWRPRRDLYRRRTARVREGLASLGIRALLRPEDNSSMLTAFELPAGMEYSTLHDALKRAGFVIYAGQGQLAASIFRIATMGAIEDTDLDRLLTEIAGVAGAAR
jgi:2-aminoethylphosphonate-pyruvate transaminase